MTDMPQETPQAAPTVARKIAPRVAVLDATSPAPETSRLSGISSFQYLLLTGCVVALGLMATRALFGALPTSHASTEYRQATAALDATLDEVRQAMLAGQDLPEPADATVAVTEFPGPFRMLRVESRVEDALISAVVAAGSFRAAPRAQPATPDDLPRLSADTTALSAAHLAAAAEGFGSAALHELLRAIVAGDAAAMPERLSAVAAIGHSSGWDALAGAAAVLAALADTGDSRTANAQAAAGRL